VVLRGHRSGGWPRVTMADVAREANVSNASVSRYLDGVVPVSEATRAAIVTAIEKTGYIRNDAARQLAKTTSDTVGLLLRDPRNPAYGAMHAELQARTAQRRLQLLTVASPLDFPEADERAGLRRLLQNRVGGMLIATGVIAPEELVPFVSAVPTVVLGRPEEHPALHAVCYDEVANGRLIADQVLALGHRDVAVVVPGRQVSVAEHLRSTVIVERLRAGGAHAVTVPTDHSVRYPADRSTSEVVKLARAGRVSAVMLPTDMRLLAFLGEAQQAGVRVPEDVSATGIDGLLPGLELLGLATVRLPVETLTRRGMDVLTDLMTAELISEHPHTAHHEAHPGDFRPGRTLQPNRS